jgi:hypothetical protein
MCSLRSWPHSGGDGDRVRSTGDITLASTFDVGIKGKGDSFFDESKGGG